MRAIYGRNMSPHGPGLHWQDGLARFAIDGSLANTLLPVERPSAKNLPSNCQEAPMTEIEHRDSNTGPTEEFVRLVKQALESLYDLPALDRHPLARDVAVTSRPGETACQLLRSELMAGIEALNPGPNTPFRAPWSYVPTAPPALHRRDDYPGGSTPSWGYRNARRIATSATPTRA